MAKLVTGWSRTQELRSKAIGGGVKMRAPRVVGAGPAHALLEGSETALCGAPVMIVGHPWPSAFGAKCRACEDNVAAAATPLGE